jgi:phage gp46-like protein
MARVWLHSGNPPGAISPPWGGRDILGSNSEFARGRPRPQSVHRCTWCGSTGKVDMSSMTPLCKRCRKLGRTVRTAKSYMALHALRPLNASSASESTAELIHRRAARQAERTLNLIKVEVMPRKAQTSGSS